MFYLSIAVWIEERERGIYFCFVFDWTKERGWDGIRDILPKKKN